jgi:ribonuclease VapC
LILDSSAVMAVLFGEQGHERLEEAMEAAEVLGIGAPTLFETSMVSVGAFGLHGQALVSSFVERWHLVVAPFDDRHRRVAADAFVRYGKGRHPAALNFGDCMSYAAAKVADAPLLFVGEDFAKTDVAVA